MHKIIAYSLKIVLLRQFGQDLQPHLADPDGNRQFLRRWVAESDKVTTLVILQFQSYYLAILDLSLWFQKAGFSGCTPPLEYVLSTAEPRGEAVESALQPAADGLLGEGVDRQCDSRGGKGPLGTVPKGQELGKR